MFGMQLVHRGAGSSERSAHRLGRHTKVATVVLSIGLLAAGCGVGSGGSSPSYAPPTQGQGPNGAFYAVPSVASGTLNGQLLYYTPATSGQISNATLTTVAYASTDAQGAPDVVTGTVIVPTAPWLSLSPRPIVDYAVGTQGLGQTCAPSKEFTNGLEYEDPNINAALGAGYAVAVSDYQWSGTTNTAPPTYMVGLAQGHAVLDMARVAPQVPGSGLSSKASVFIWGYSQGGNAAGEAGQMWSSYAPDVNLKGVAAGGVPGDLPAVGVSLDGSAFAGFLFATVIGFHGAYPDLPFSTLINSAGVTALANVETQCEATIVTNYAGQSITQYTVGGITIQQALAEGNWTPDLLANSPGQPGSSIPVPVYNYRGAVDEVIPTAVEDGVYANWCASGTVIQSNTYTGEHALSDFEAQSDVLTFISNQLAGKTPVNSCTTNNKTL
jgi:Secretory lipase